MTKREFIEAIEATDSPDDAPVLVFDAAGRPLVVEQVRDSHAGPGVFVATTEFGAQTI